MPYQMSLEEFRAALDDLAVTQTWFAETVGVDVMTVNRWATGRIDVPLWVTLVVHLLRRERDRFNALPSAADLDFADAFTPSGLTSGGSGARADVRTGSGVISFNDDRDGLDDTGAGSAGS